MQTSGTFDFTLRYQRTPFAKYHVRPLSLLQQEIMYRCDGTVTIADLADMTLSSHPEIRDVLSFLSVHGLVKTLMPESWLFQPPGQPSVSYRSPQLSPHRHTPQPMWRLWHALTGLLSSFLNRQRAFS